MTIKIKLLHPNARIPEYKTVGASGMDLYAVEDVKIRNAETVTVRTGVAVEIPDGFEGLIRPRSSLSAYGLLCHLGTIDHDYRGELAVVFTNLCSLQSMMPIFEPPAQIRAGDRIAQLVIAPVSRVEVVQVDELSETARGGGGFGSTGR